MALQEAIAEINIKDLASKSLGKIEQTLRKQVSAMKAGEKEAGNLNKALSGISGEKGTGQSKIGAAVQQMNAKGQAMASAVGAGSGFHQAISQFHFVGPYIAAALTALQGSAADAKAKYQLYRQRAVVESNYHRALGKVMGDGIKVFTDSYFHIRDTQAALTKFADMGVKAETLKSNADVLKLFAESQGYETLDEAMSALASGIVKDGRGLSKQQQAMIKAFAPMLQNTFSADIGMQNIARVLKDAAPEIKGAADEFASSAGKAIANTVAIQKIEEETTLAKGGTIRTIESAANVERMEARLRDLMGSGAEWGMRKSESIYRQFAGRALGGSVTSAEGPYIVGEKGPEVFMPATTGRILPTHHLRGGGSVTINNNISINGGNVADVKRAVIEAVEHAAKTIWRQNLSLGGVA